MELLTNTKRRDYLNCPRYFYHRHEERLEIRTKKGGRRRGSIFGDAIQTARDFDEAETTGTEDEMLELYGNPIEAAMASIDTSYRQLESLGEVDNQDDADRLDVEEIKMCVMVRAYIERYGLRPRREVEFDLPLIHPSTGGQSTRFRRGGKLDGLEVVGDKQARIIEDKLVKSVQRAMIDRLPLDAQASEYVDAILARGWEATVAYRHTRWPGINPSKEKIPPEFTPSGKPSTAKYVPAEKLDDFERRLEEDVAERVDWYFDQQTVTYPKVHLDDYRDGRWGTAQHILFSRQLARQENFEVGFPMNPSRCWEYGGCEFIPLCTKQDGARERYVVVGDNPELSIGRSQDATNTYGTETA